MILYIICFVCGVFIAQVFPYLPTYSQIYLALSSYALLLLIIISIKNYIKHRHYSFYINLCKIIICLTIIFFAMIYSLLYALHLNQWSLPKNLINQNVVISGYVNSLPNEDSKYVKFKFYTESINYKKQQVQLLLNWYEDVKNRPKILAGNKWQLIVKLKPPHTTYNQGEFDYEKYLWQQHIRATGYVVIKNPNNKILPSTTFTLKNILLNWRQRVKNAIHELLPNQPLTNMLNALVLGDQSEVTSQQWEILRITGTTYLLAIAGLHICLMAGVVFSCVYFLWKKSAKLILFIPPIKIASIIGLCGGIFYSIISGFSIPTQRALFMLSIFTIVRFGKNYFTNWQSLFFSMFIIVLFDPLAILSLGFWLSFIAMGTIFYITDGRLQLSNNYWKKYLRLQGAITLGLIPFTLHFFSQASFMTVIANIFAMPAVCLFVVPLSLLGSFLLFISPLLAKYVLLLSEKIMEITWYGLQFLGKFTYLTWQQPIFTWWQIALAIIGVLLILAPKGFIGKSVSVIWCMPLIFYMPKQPKDNELWLHILDVGQGLATVISSKNHVMVYDTGPKSLSDSDAGERTLIPFLQQQGIKNIDVLMVSHGDDDHIGGANSLLKAIHVDKIITSVPEKFSHNTINSTVTNCYAGQQWHWDNINFLMLHPQKNTEYIGNGSSCVVKITNGKNSILLTGDIEKKQEKFILQTYSDTNILKSNILIAPHHGSKTSSSQDFINQVQPQYTIFPVGFYNRFHFPSKDTVERYKQITTLTYETQNTGTIFFKIFPEQNIKLPLLYRQTQHRYWME